MKNSLLPPFQLNQDTLTRLDKSPLISVIIANYNYGKFIGQAIESVLAQSYQKFELIVVDDGSTDESKEVINSYKNHHSDLISVFKENGGQGSGFNAGFERSSGEIICFLDSDDYFAEEKLKEIVDGFNSHPDWVQISHLCISIDVAGNEIGRNSNRSLTEGDARPLLLKVGKYGSMRTSAISFRRQVLEKIMPVPAWKTSSDAYLINAAPFYGKIGKLDKGLTYYRFHSNNAHGGSKKIDYHIYHRQQVIDVINQTAKKLNLNQRFYSENDADYMTWKMIQSSPASLLHLLRVTKLVFIESFYIRRALKDVFVRLAWISMCALNSDEGNIVLENGLKKYVQIKLNRSSTSI